MSQQQPNTEKLNFKIGISGIYWNKKPQYRILINNETMASGTILSELINVVQYVTFSCDLEEDKNHELVIRLENKTDKDTVKNPPTGEVYVIEKDLVLNIDSIEIDDISLEQLIWTASKFVPDDPEKPTLTNCVNLGWNGSYILSFSCPFYIWLLENM